MRRNKKKIAAIFLIFLSIISIEINMYAHSGRTDSNGGHKDNQNKSGLGSYHYHCGGNPAHLHTNGVCPYSSSKSSTSSSSSSTTTTNKETNTITATGIKINEIIESIEVGENKKLTAVITPSNATNKNTTWTSSDNSIATVNSEGEVIAKKSGTVNITASTSNGKTDTIKINITEKNTVETSTTSKNKTTTNNTSNNQEDSNPLGGILTLGLLGGGAYLGYRKIKKDN